MEVRGPALCIAGLVVLAGLVAPSAQAALSVPEAGPVPATGSTPDTSLEPAGADGPLTRWALRPEPGPTDANDPTDDNDPADANGPSAPALPSIASLRTSDAWRTTAARCVVPGPAPLWAALSAGPIPLLPAAGCAVAGTGPGGGGGGSGAGPGLAVGGTRFAVEAGEDEVLLEAAAAEASTSWAAVGARPLAADLAVLDGDGALLDIGSFCGSTQRALAADAASVWVLPRPGATAACAPGGGPLDVDSHGPAEVRAAFQGADATDGADGPAPTCLHLLLVPDPTPGAQALEVGLCPLPPVTDGDGRSCVHTVRTVCVVADTGDGSFVRVRDAPACPGAVESLRIDVGDGKVFLCVGVQTSADPRLPPFSVTPPSGGFAGVTGVAVCQSGLGGTVTVLGNGAEVCVEVDVSTDGRFFDVDLTPCPQGVDPRVDLAGIRVRVCIIVVPKTDLPSDPEVEPPEVGDLLPEVDLSACPGGMDPSVHWLGVDVQVCLVVDPWLPSGPAVASCGPGQVGALVEVAGATFGVCIE